MSAALDAPAAQTGVVEAAQPEVVIGSLAGIDDTGAPLVDWPGNLRKAPLQALSTTTYSASDAGQSVALLFADGNPDRPLIIGVIRRPLDEIVEATIEGNEPQPRVITPPQEAKVDGQRVVLSAEKEIVLQCGKASITLTSAGKLLLRGAYLLSRSSGVNRIKGGSVQIN